RRVPRKIPEPPPGHGQTPPRGHGKGSALLHKVCQRPEIDLGHPVLGIGQRQIKVGNQQIVGKTSHSMSSYIFCYHPTKCTAPRQAPRDDYNKREKTRLVSCGRPGGEIHVSELVPRPGGTAAGGAAGRHGGGL